MLTFILLMNNVIYNKYLNKIILLVVLAITYKTFCVICKYNKYNNIDKNKLKFSQYKGSLHREIVIKMITKLCKIHGLWEHLYYRCHVRIYECEGQRQNFPIKLVCTECEKHTAGNLSACYLIIK